MITLLFMMLLVGLAHTARKTILLAPAYNACIARASVYTTHVATSNAQQHYYVFSKCKQAHALCLRIALNC
jgi:hypothetical protein